MSESWHMLVKHEAECDVVGGYFQSPEGDAPNGVHRSFSAESSTESGQHSLLGNFLSRENLRMTGGGDALVCCIEGERPKYRLIILSQM